MLARTFRALPGAMIALILSLSPALAGQAPAKQKVMQTRPRVFHTVRGRLRHARMRIAHETADVGLSDGDEPTSPHAIESGIASWYGGWFNGRRTSSGRIYHDSELTAAHPWLPLGTRVKVRLVGTDRSVDVTITDRPGTRRRIIDLSREAARELGMMRYGTALVTLSEQ